MCNLAWVAVQSHQHIWSCFLSSPTSKVYCQLGHQSSIQGMLLYYPVWNYKMTLKNSSLLPLNSLQIIYSTGYSYQIYLLFLNRLSMISLIPIVLMLTITNRADKLSFIICLASISGALLVIPGTQLAVHQPGKCRSPLDSSATGWQLHIRGTPEFKAGSIDNY